MQKPTVPVSELSIPDGQLRLMRDELVRTIKGHYDEMPGLALTAAQGQRLWHVEALICGCALDAMVNEGTLVKTPKGSYIRA